MNASRPPVVVGVSRAQPAVVRYALAEAGRRGVALRVVHCHDAEIAAAASHRGRGNFLGPIELPPDHALAEAHALVKSEAPSQIVTYVDVEGDTSGVLIAHADEAAVIVLGAGEPSWFDRVLGSAVTGRLARHASCPVVVVPERSEEKPHRGAVVVTVHGDSSAAGALSYGFEQAQSRDEILIILHALPLGTSERDFESHRANVAEIIAGWGDLFPDVKVLTSSTFGGAADASVSASRSASMVVIGRPRGPVHSFALLRPVALDVIRRARCAVAIVPPDYRSDRVSDSTRGGRQSTSA